MKRDEFIELLKRKNYAHKVTENGVSVTHNGYVDLRSLTSLPKGVKFENGGFVYLRSLTTLPKGVKFENSGYVDLDGLTGEHSYLGKTRNFRCVDGFTMLMGASKTFGGFSVCSARYFGGGEVEKLKKCYVAESGNITAHGDTMKSAVEDLQYKLADSADKASIAAEIIATGTVTLAQFRGLTGACRDGIRQHLSSVGIDLDAIDEMPLTDALKAMGNTSFGETFKSYVEVA